MLSLFLRRWIFLASLLSLGTGQAIAQDHLIEIPLAMTDLRGLDRPAILDNTRADQGFRVLYRADEDTCARWTFLPPEPGVYAAVRVLYKMTSAISGSIALAMRFDQPSVVKQDILRVCHTLVPNQTNHFGGITCTFDPAPFIRGWDAERREYAASLEVCRATRSTLDTAPGDLEIWKVLLAYMPQPSQ